MPIQLHQAPENWQHLIIECWDLSHTHSGVPPSFQVLPDGFIELVVNFGDPYQVVLGESAFDIGQGVYLRGLCLDPITVQFGPRICVWGIRLHPAWVQYYLGIPLAEGFRKVIQVESLGELGKIQAQNPDAFLHAFIGLLKNPSLPVQQNEMHRAVQTIEQYAGTLAIPELADICCVSVSGLERRFKRMFGLSPKAYSQLVKFRFIARYLADGKSADQLDLIADFDLTDASHLNKITHAFSQESPEKLKAKISRFFTKAYKNG